MTASSNNDDSGKTIPRGDFNLLGIKKDRKPKAKVIMVIGGGVIFLFVAISVIFYSAFSAMEANNPNKVDESKVRADAALEPKQVSDDEIQRRREQILKRRNQEEQKQHENAVNPIPAPSQASQPQPQPQPPSAAYMRKLGGGVTVQETGANDSQLASSDPNTTTERPARSDIQPVISSLDSDSATSLSAPVEGSRGSLSDLQGTSYAATKASLSPDRKYLLKRKSNLRCSLYTAVKTNHPGFVKCILIQPLYSSDGSVILAEAGAELDGEQKVEVRPGDSSVFTTWTDLETAGGVRANMNALGTGPMGESGTEAYVDNHYGQKFGGAVMLSFIQDAFASAANSTKKNNSTYSFDNSESNAENMATKALDNSINIPSTGYVLPGTVINVIVAQDIDFSSVFKTRKLR